MRRPIALNRAAFSSQIFGYVVSALRNVFAMFAFLLCFVGCYETANSRLTVQRTSGPSQVRDSLWTGWTEKNSAVWAGGAVHYDSPQNVPSLLISTCYFQDCWNGWEPRSGDKGQLCPDSVKGGGGIFTDKVNLEAENCYFISCKAVSGRGGAILARGEAANWAEIWNCTFENCIAEGTPCPQQAGGGAVAAETIMLKIWDSHFTNCDSQSFGGGAIYANAAINCTECDFTSCTASGHDENRTGGAIWIQGDTADRQSIVTGCKFVECSAYAASAVYYSGTQPLEVTTCWFTDCSAEHAGTCLWLSTPTLSFSSLWFSVVLSLPLVKIEGITGSRHILGCHVDGKGGAISSNDNWILFPDENEDVTVEECSFENFSRTGNGGGAFRFEGQRDVTILDCQFSHIKCTGSGVNGGAIVFPSGSNVGAKILGCQFEACVAAGKGGAIFCSCGTSGTFNATRCTFVRNEATSGGGQSVYVDKGSFTASDNEFIWNCTFAEHQKPSLFQVNEWEQGPHVQWIMRDCIYRDNVIPADGGSGGLLCVHARGGMIYQNCEFIRNTCRSPGGLLALALSTSEGDRPIEFRDSLFSFCETGDTGMFTSTRRARLTLSGCRFLNCTSASSVVITTENSYAALTVTDCKFIGCSAQGPVFGFGNSNAATFTNCQFTECSNSQESQGGALFFSNSYAQTATVTGCTFTRCTAASGAAIYYDRPSGSPRVEDCTFDANDGQSGASMRIVLPDGAALSKYYVQNCTFSGHSDTPLCAGYSNEDSEMESFTLTDLKFINNHIPDSSTTGIIGMWAPSSTYYKCVFQGNEGGSGSGIVSITNRKGEGGANCTFRECCFEECSQKGVGGILFGSSTASSPTLTLDQCVFSSCKARILNSPSLTLLIENCDFEYCEDTTGAPGLFGNGNTAQLTCTQAAVVMTSFLYCRSLGGTNVRVLSIVSDDLRLESTNISLAVTREYAVQFELPTKTKELLIEGCRFSNNGTNVGQRFIDIADTHQKVRFLDCEFVDIGTNTGGAGLKLSLTTEDATLTVTGCNFTGCSCHYDGGAIHGQSTKNVVISGCRFEECSSREGYPSAGGSGGIYIRTDTQSGSITDCVFINNNSPMNAQSLLIQFADGQGYDRIELRDCKFQGHRSGSIIAFVYTKKDNRCYVFDGSYTLSSCVFEGDPLSLEKGLLTTFGVLNANSTGGVTYDNCQFKTVYSGSWDSDECVIAVGNPGSRDTSQYRLVDCQFNQCSRSDWNYGMLQNSADSVLGELSIENCSFTSCYASVIKLNYQGIRAVKIHQSVFNDCETQGGGMAAVLSMGPAESPTHVQSLEVIGCTIENCGVPSYSSEGTGTAIMDVHSGESVIDSCVFESSMNFEVVAISVYIQGSDQASFNNCSFKSTVTGMKGISHVLHGKMSGDVQSGQMTVHNCSFSDWYGVPKPDGLGILADFPGTLVVSESRFVGMSNAQYGAAVYGQTTTKIELRQTRFERCSGMGSDTWFGGGAVYVSSSFDDVVLEDCEFSENTCGSNGQSLQLAPDKSKPHSISITNCSFNGHSGSLPIIALKIKAKEGTREDIYENPITLTQCKFEENNFVCSSGVLYISGSSVTYDHCQFVRCTPSTTDSASCVLEVSSPVTDSSFSVLFCTFSECRQGNAESGLIRFSTQNAGDRTLTIDNCSFTECSGGSGVIAILSPRIVDMIVTSNEFSSCSSVNSPSVLLIAQSQDQNAVKNFVFESNTCNDCKGADAMSVMKFKPDSITFRGNVFNLVPAKYHIHFDVTYACTLEDCTFDHQNQEVSDQVAQVLYFPSVQDLKFMGCTFRNLMTDGYSAIYIPRQGQFETLDVFNCYFIRCNRKSYSMPGGGAIYSGRVTSLSVTDCLFDACESQQVDSQTGGGAIYIHQNTQEGAIRNCTFVNNNNLNGMSILLLRKESDPKSIEIANCTFKDHRMNQVGSIVSIVYLDQANQDAPAPYPYTVSEWNFVNNHLTVTSGLVSLKSQNDIVYENCSFVDSSATHSGALFALNDKLQAFRLLDCSVEYTTSTDVHALSLISIPSGSTLSQLELDTCVITGAHMYSTGLVSFASSYASTLAGSQYCESITIKNCIFNRCKSDSGSFVDISATNVQLLGNELVPGEGSQTPISISVTSGVSTIRDTLFTTSSTTGPMISLTSPADTEIQFYNCCFSNTNEEMSETVYLGLINVQGTVNLCTVCFKGTTQSSAFQGGLDHVIFDGEPADFFGDNCVCWTGSVTTEIPSEIPPSSSDPDTEEPPSELPTKGPTETEPTQETHDTDDPESGSGGSANGGLIAGVVIAVLVIIAVVVVLVILFLRRRKRGQSDEEVTGNEEFQEETVTTVQADNPTQGFEWSQTSEDNPLFTTEGDDAESPFANAFEEGGAFFGE